MAVGEIVMPVVLGLCVAGILVWLIRKITGR